MKKWIFIVFAALVLVLGGLWTLTNGFQSFTQPNNNEWELNIPEPQIGATEDTMTTEETETPEISSEISESSEPVAENTTETEITESANESPMDEIVESTPDTPHIMMPESGSLVFQIRGKNQGTETYQFSMLDNGGYQAFADGELTTEIAFIPISVAYRQLLQMDENLRPTYFATELKGPLGFGNQSTQVQLDELNATLTSGRKEIQFELPAEKLIVINMFGTFALFPMLFELGSPLATFQALDAGGFDDNGEGPSGTQYRLGTMALKQMGTIQLRVNDESIFAERYLLKIAGPQDDYQLLFDQGRWIGVIGEVQDDQGGLFLVYRSDLYPDGFEVVNPPY